MEDDENAGDNDGGEAFTVKVRDWMEKEEIYLCEEAWYQPAAAICTWTKNKDKKRFKKGRELLKKWLKVLPKIHILRKYIFS